MNPYITMNTLMHSLLNRMKGKDGGLVFHFMLVMHLLTRSFLIRTKSSTGLRYVLPWILRSGTYVFLHLEGRRHPTTWVIQCLFVQQKPIVAKRKKVLTQLDNDSNKSTTQVLTSLDGDPNVKRRMVTIDPDDLIGRTFLKDSEEDLQ